MARLSFTAKRIEEHSCPDNTKQAFIWDTDAPGLGLRATESKAKAYVFQARLENKTIRRTIGDPKAWTIEGARVEARRLQVLIDRGIDPRQEDADRKAEAITRQETQEAEVAQAVQEARAQSLTVADPHV